MHKTKYIRMIRCCEKRLFQNQRLPVTKNRKYLMDSFKLILLKNGKFFQINNKTSSLIPYVLNNFIKHYNG